MTSIRRPGRRTDGERTTVGGLRARRLGAVLVAAGVVHLLAPRPLLWTARVGYRTVLRARFDPGEASARRVRAVGVGMVLAGAHLLYHGGVVPRGVTDRLRSRPPVPRSGGPPGGRGGPPGT